MLRGLTVVFFTLCFTETPDTQQRRRRQKKRPDLVSERLKTGPRA